MWPEKIKDDVAEWASEWRDDILSNGYHTVYIKLDTIVHPHLIQV